MGHHRRLPRSAVVSSRAAGMTRDAIQTTRHRPATRQKIASRRPRSEGDDHAQSAQSRAHGGQQQPVPSGPGTANGSMPSGDEAAQPSPDNSRCGGLGAPNPRIAKRSHTRGWPRVFTRHRQSSHVPPSGKRRQRGLANAISQRASRSPGPLHSHPARRPA